MKTLLVIFINFFFITSLFAQNHAPVVSNVTAQQRTGTKLVDITYNVSDADGDTLTISVQVSGDSGKTFTITPVTFLAGSAVGSGIRPGTGKTIVWNAGVDYPNQYGTKFQVKITADDNKVGTVTDIDGNVYHTVVIGNQEWMVENLKVTKYRDGASIPNITNDSQWGSLSTGAYGNYNNDASNAATYGRLYNWYAVNDSRGLAPTGWRVPTDADWQTLVDYLGGSSVAGGKLKETGTSHWAGPNTGATNSSGFTALPGGYRSYSTGQYFSIGDLGYFWSSSGSLGNNAWYRRLNFGYSDFSRYLSDKGGGFSVRCVRDK